MHFKGKCQHLNRQFAINVVTLEELGNMIFIATTEHRMLEVGPALQNSFCLFILVFLAFWGGGVVFILVLAVSILPSSLLLGLPWSALGPL